MFSSSVNLKIDRQQLFSLEKREDDRKNKSRLKNLWDDIKMSSVCIIGLSEEEERMGQKKLFEELMAKTSPNLEKDIH